MLAPTELSERTRYFLKSQMKHYVNANLHEMDAANRKVARNSALTPASANHLVVTNSRAFAAAEILEIMEGEEALLRERINHAYNVSMKNNTPDECQMVYLEALSIIREG